MLPTTLTNEKSAGLSRGVDHVTGYSCQLIQSSQIVQIDTECFQRFLYFELPCSDSFYSNVLTRKSRVVLNINTQ